jgi:hypothetical protein
MNNIVRAIAIKDVDWVETGQDLSAIGFIRKEGTNRWYNSDYYSKEDVDKIEIIY